MAATPIGTLTKKTQRHVRFVTKNPPNTGPRAGARVVGTVMMLATRMRSDGGNARYSMAMPTGIIMPPPAPWTTRKATSWVMFWATPHSAEPIVKTTMDISNTLLPPKRSPSQPDEGMKTARLTRYAITMPSTAVGGIWKSRPIVGSATLTIVTSMMFMNMADTNTTPTAIFWFMRFPWSMAMLSFSLLIGGCLRYPTYHMRRDTFRGT